MKNRKNKNKMLFVIAVCVMLFICGGMVTSVVPNHVITVEAKAPCKHTRGYARFGSAVGQEKKTINDDDEYCYKTRKYYKQKCVDCGTTMSTYSFDSWKKHKHNYWFFKKNCNECGRKK